MVAKAKEIDGFDKDTIYQDLKKEIMERKINIL